jgi:hypothetical protein
MASFDYRAWRGGRASCWTVLGFEYPVAPERLDAAYGELLVTSGTNAEALNKAWRECQADLRERGLRFNQVSA